MTRSGLSTKDVSFIGVGSGAPGMTALERKEVDALVYFDPVATMVEKRKTAKPLVDTRNAAGAMQAFGGNYPTACLYTTRKFIEQNPETVQRMVNAFLRTLKWMAANPPEAIADKTPKNELLGDKALFTEALRNSRGIFSTDGLFNEQDAMIPVKVLGSYDEKIAKANIDIKKTFTNQFVLVAQKQVK